MSVSDRRIDAVGELMVAEVRENVGDHRYDGLVQDLSHAGVTAALARLGDGEPLADPHDEAHLATWERGLTWFFGEYQAHRRDPFVHLNALDLACYDREYAPQAERDAARARHLAAWPDAVDVAVTTLDAVPAPVATALLPAVRGLAQALDATPPPAADDVVDRARAAHARLVAHLEHVAATGDPDCAIGAEALATAMGAFDAVDVDLSALAARADAERDRLRGMLEEGCARIDSSRPAHEVMHELMRDHPDIDGVLAEARTLTDEVLSFTRAHELVPWTDGECLVGPAPESRKWALAMMAWAGPEEADAPSWYHVTPPDPDWPAEEIEAWLSVFSRTTLPAITVHEVAPGHYAHGRALRRLTSPVRRRMMSMAFAEGWAHYVEELVVDLGFRGGDPRYAIGVAHEALIRVTRLACAIGLHTDAMTVDDATARFENDALLLGAAARSEANRGTFDVTYGRYTWGKLAVQDLREEAKAQWGADFSLKRLHAALLALGSPPLGLMRTALTRG
jgi:hypothetical protein